MGKDQVEPQNADDFDPEDSAGYNEASHQYWQQQDAALGKIRTSHSNWTRQRRIKSAESKNALTWKRVSFSLPREQAQKKAREFLEKYPKAAYWSEVESWRELPGDVIEFTMRRLPSAD